MIKQHPDERWDAILGMLESIASLDFSRTLPISDKADEMDAVASGLNMLSEELQANVVERSKLARIVTELEVANKELQAFSDALAHDLRNPLLIVTNFSHQLHETLDDSLNEQQKEDLQRIQAAGRHMMHIVDDLSVLVPDRDVRFEADRGIMALGDKTLLRILLSNLLQNAWKYTGPRDDAWIELGVVEDEDDVPIYHVRDNGIGFDNADREIIFKAFERLHTRQEFAGSGLGLATVERIVRRHGGQVWGEGVLGDGAVFRFTLGSSSTGE